MSNYDFSLMIWTALTIELNKTTYEAIYVNISQINYF